MLCKTVRNFKERMLSQAKEVFKIMRALRSFFGTLFTIVLVFSMLLVLIYTPSRVTGFPYALKLDPQSKTITFLGNDYYFDFSLLNSLKSTALEILALNKYLFPHADLT